MNVTLSRHCLPVLSREERMIRRRLPIGIQSFRRLRETNSYYVDKTSLVRTLIDQGDHWFLSRPRRFGKSCCSTRFGVCSRVTRRCSMDWISMSIGTGPPRRIRCCD